MTITVLAIGLLLTLVFSFFFTSVAANAIATTARNPVSGMTMLTIIISSIVLLQVRPFGHDGNVLRDGDRRNGVHGAVGLGTGDHGPEGGLLAGLDAIGAGEGEIPGRDRGGDCGWTDDRDAGTDVPVRRCGGGRVCEPVLPSPQASIMKALVEGFMSHQPVAYVLFGVGAMITLMHGDAGTAVADLRAGNVLCRWS